MSSRRVVGFLKARRNHVQPGSLEDTATADALKNMRAEALDMLAKVPGESDGDQLAALLNAMAGWLYQPLYPRPHDETARC